MFLFRVIPSNLHIFLNCSCVIDIIPIAGSANVTVVSETSRTATQWSSMNASLITASVNPASFNCASESNVRYWLTRPWAL